MRYCSFPTWGLFLSLLGNSRFSLATRGRGGEHDSLRNCFNSFVKKEIIAVNDEARQHLFEKFGVACLPACAFHQRIEIMYLNHLANAQPCLLNWKKSQSTLFLRSRRTTTVPFGAFENTSS